MSRLLKYYFLYFISLFGWFNLKVKLILFKEVSGSYLITKGFSINKYYKCRSMVNLDLLVVKIEDKPVIRINNVDSFKLLNANINFIKY